MKAVLARRARVPASTANLGPGFDSLALALDCYIEVTIRPALALAVTTIGEGELLAQDGSHLAARVAAGVIGHDHFDITVRSSIPLARGLGSSAALAAAAAAAAGCDDPLAVATSVDGHPENAAASVLGGLVAATMVDGKPVAVKHPLDRDLGFIVLVPQRPLKTSEARAALPASVPHSDAAFNLSRMGVLLAGLADASQLIPAAFEDRLHQPYRSSLFPQASEILAGLAISEVLGTCWSGAGPSLLAVCHKADMQSVRTHAETQLKGHCVEAAVLVLQADLQGLVVEQL